MFDYKKLLVKNTLYNSVGKIWSIIITLALTPYIVNHLGLKMFGVWAVVGIITQYFGLFDFGVGTSFVKYIAEHYAENDDKSINYVINTGFVFYFFVGVLVVFLAVYFRNPILHFFGVPITNSVVIVLIISALLFSLSNMFAVFNAVLLGLQRMDIINIISIIITIPFIVGTVLFLKLGYGIVGLAINNVIIFVLSTIVTIYFAHKIYEKIKFNPLSLNFEVFKKLFFFGVKLQVSQISELVQNYTDKILISRLVNISYVTFYEIGSKVDSAVRSLPLLLVTAIVPAASDLDTKGEKEKIYKIFLRSTKYMLILGAPLLAFVIVFAKPIIFNWMGPGYDKAIFIVQILAIGYFANMSTGAISAVVQGMGIPEYQTYSTLIIIFVNLIASYLLILKYGFYGAAYGPTLALTISAIYYFYIFHRVIKRSLIKFIKEILLKPVFIASVIGLISAFLLNKIPYLITSGRSILSMVSLIVCFIIFSSLYLFLLYLMKYVTSEEWLLFKDTLVSIKKAIQKSE